MDIWSVLGIDNTKDKDELKKAYRRKLAKTNPEDNPDGFMELRTAYEEALRLADEIDDENNSDIEEDNIAAKIKQVYNSFQRRIEPQEWKRLFDMDAFVSLNTSEKAFDTLMRFLMENFCIPKTVWEVICNTFDIIERKKELCSVYPEDFIDYVINNATFDDMIDYNLFEGNDGYFDRYIDLYYKLDAAIRKKDLKAQSNFIEEMEALDVYHPYFEVCKARHIIQQMLDSCTGDDIVLTDENKAVLEELQQRAHELYLSNNEDIFIINFCGDIALFKEDYDKAKSYYDISYGLAPDNYMVMGKQAELNYYLGEYEKSRDIYMDLLKINHYDNNVRAGMIRANQGLIDIHRKALEVNPNDDKARMEISWSLYQSYRFEEAIQELDLFEPTEETCFEYYNLKGRTYLCLENYDKALSCFFKWKNAIESIPQDDMSEDAEKKRKRYEYANFLISDCYLKTGRYDEARKYLETALKKEHEEIILSMEAMCELEYESGNMEACLDACEKLFERDSRSYIGYDYMAKAYYRMGYANEAINCCEHAISIYPYVAEPYALEIKIFIRLDKTDIARDVLDSYREYGIDSDRIDYAEAQILEAENRYEDAIALLVAAINRGDEQESDMKNYSDLHMMLAGLYEQVENNDNAIDIYEKIINMEPSHWGAYGRLGILYRDNDRLDDAVNMLSKQLEINPSGYYYIQRAIIYKYLDKFEEAKKDYMEGLKDDTDNYFCYSRLALIYEREGSYAEAVECFDKAFMYIDEDEKQRERRAYITACKARTLQCAGDFVESEKLYKQYMDENGMNPDVVYDYSELLLRTNRMDAAIDILNKCINSVEYCTDVQMCIRQLIYVYGTEGYIDKANEALQLAISKDPYDFRAYGSLGNSFRNRGKYKEARKLFEKAVELSEYRISKGISNDSNNYYLELAEVIILERAFFKQGIDVYLKKGYSSFTDYDSPFDLLKLLSGKKAEKKPGEAIDLADRAIKLNRCSGCFYSGCHEAYFEKGVILESLKEYKLALECYKEALRIVGHNAIYEEKIRRLENNDSRNRFRNNK